jgi:hypothetical protein
MNELVSQPDLIRRPSEAGSLARELGAAFRASVQYHKTRVGLPAPEAVAKAEEPATPDYLDRVMTCPADQLSWADLGDLARTNPDLAERRWGEVRQEAMDELRSGHRAARATEGYTSDLWQRARFLAVRDDLTDAWQPRNGAERQLIDMMAQAQATMLFWQERLAVRASVEPLHEHRDVEERGGWTPPRVSEHQATEQAAGMVDRFHRMYLRTLRTLRDLRRGPPPVVVQNARQVNVAGSQLNLSAGHR